ncbi:MAG: hypothetical protein RL681_691 [Candidatus Parcubacteria bacterium]|jgi:cell shape-determining protein MreC
MAGKLIIGIGLFAIIALAVFFPQAGWRLQRWFSWDNGEDIAGVERALVENQTLKAELARLAPLSEILPAKHSSTTRIAEVFSRYPFSVRNAMIIGVGENDSIRSGEPVFLATKTDSSPQVMIGVVTDVRNDTATVQTLFDPKFKTAVRVGSSGADALLIGGPEPTLSLISKAAQVQSGDIVVSASPEFPLGVPLATVGILRPAEDQAFKNATLMFSYDIADIRVVQVDLVAP